MPKIVIAHISVYALDKNQQVLEELKTLEGFVAVTDDVGDHQFWLALTVPDDEKNPKGYAITKIRELPTLKDNRHSSVGARTTWQIPAAAQTWEPKLG